MRNAMRRLVPLVLLSLVTACLPDGGSTAGRNIVTVTPDSVVVFLGDTLTLKATVTKASGTPIVWTSSSPGVASIAQTGKVTGVAVGVATITANSDGLLGTSIVVIKERTTIKVGPDSAILAVGQTSQFTAVTTGVPTGTSPQWAVADGTVASVTTTGNVVALNPGVTTVSATVLGVVSTAKVIVRAATVKLTPDSVSLVIGQQIQLSASVVGAALGSTTEWASTDPTIASVSNLGVVTAVQPGKVRITASNGGATASTTVVVKPITVQLTPASSSLFVGGTVQFTATVSGAPVGATTVWSVSNQSVASITSNGFLTALAPGTTQVAATVNGVTATATVTVQAGAVNRVLVCDLSNAGGCSASASLQGVGTAVNVRASAYDAGGFDISSSCTFGWRVLNPGIVTLTISADRREALMVRNTAGSTSVLVDCGDKTGVFTVLSPTTTP
jgi:uncharacterized protein YjdB